MKNQKRKVSRVLVMIEYEPGNPNNGEVFDLTALVQEMATKGSSYSPHISVTVDTDLDYTQQPAAPKLQVSFGGYAGGEWISRASHLEDVVNYSLPDNQHVKRFRAAAERLRKRAEKLDDEAQTAKLEQVSQVRHLHPIARVTAAPLADVSTPKLPA